MSSNVIWRDKEVRLQLKDASNQMLRTAAALIEQQTKLNIQSNGQIDTGFMVNSVYFVTDDDSNYENAANGAIGVRPDAEMAPEVVAPDGGAAVAVGAEYAIFQEERMPFLYPAIEHVATTMQGEIVSAGKEAID